MNFAIDSFQKLKEKTELIESLSEMKLVKSMISKCDKFKNEIDKLNFFYKELNCEIKSIDKSVKK
jgi:hypothetical protein